MTKIEWHETIDSTMRRAAELASSGAAPGTIVAAKTQTAGQGRLGRVWHSTPGGLYFTLILRPRLEPRQLPFITLAIGVAAADAVQMFANLHTDLRWPNDLLVGDRKLAGILTHYHDGAILAGIGLNLAQTAFPPDLPATSIQIETGRAPEPDLLLKALSASIQTHVHILETSGITPILRLFANASSYVSGKRVRVELPTGEVTGTTNGLTPEGFLLLQPDDGSPEITITAGGVRPA